MPVQDWSTNADQNVSVDGINIGEHCPARNLNDAIRAVMANVRADSDAKEAGIADAQAAADSASSVAAAAQTTADSAMSAVNELDENTVHKTGNETITGTKTFSNITVKKDPAHTDTVHLWTDQEGGNVRLVKGSGHMEIDSITLDQEGGFGRIFVGDQTNEVGSSIYLKKSSEIDVNANLVKLDSTTYNSSVYLSQDSYSFNIGATAKPTIALRRDTYTANPSGFDILARNANQSVTLTGRVDNNLLWGGRNVLVMPKYKEQIYGTWDLQKGVTGQVYNYTPTVPCMFVYVATVFINVYWRISLKDPTYTVLVGQGGQDMSSNTFKQTIAGFCPAGWTINCTADAQTANSGGSITYRYFPLV